MSLRYLGIAHFPVLQRQFSSPTSKGSIVSSPSQDLTQDNKDVLLERLNDLVVLLSTDSFLEDSIVSGIHSYVDRMELLIRGGESNRNFARIGSDSQVPTDNREDVFLGPLTPTKNIRMRLPELPTSARRSVQHGAQTDEARAVELAISAQDLASRLSATVAELQVRKEESDHIHDLLVTRAEKAAERILLLEYRLNEMEEDFKANQSELKFLRIQLQALEAQCSQYIPPDEDLELSQSILNWKIDWEDIDRRSKARRVKWQAPKTVLDDFQTMMDGS